MPALNIFEPTQERFFTFYDKCAIRLDATEQTSCRIRISVTILGSPLSRSVNFKYPYPKEFYGYAQTFYLTALYEEFPISYQNQIVLDYFNPHTALAHQLTDVFQRMAVYFSTLATGVATIAASMALDVVDVLLDAALEIFKLAFCFTLEIGGGEPDVDYSTDFLNAFQVPWNLIRFRFPFGTVFNVSIECWNLGQLQSGGLGGNPETDPPFDTDNPGSSSPFPTPGANDPAMPYGESPPESSPLDPTLDPDDFSNAPDPVPEGRTTMLESWTFPAIPGFQPQATAVGCPAATLADSIPILADIQNSVSQGVFIVRLDAMGNANQQDVLDGAPGFVFGDNVFGATTACGVGVPG